MEMKAEFERTKMLLGESAMAKLQGAHVAIFGVGGVGGYVAEALARSGIGTFDLVDKDTVSISNINRQLIATHKTIGQAKVEVMKARILDINPEAVVNVHCCFYLPENASDFDFSQYDYIVDAVDTVTAKLSLIERAKLVGTPIISSMGAGNKLDGSQFQIADIYKTKVCPLAKVMRRELKKRNIDSLKVVYSEEEPVRPKRECTENDIEEQEKIRPREKDVPGSVAFVPSVAGLLLAGEVVKDLIKTEK